MKKPIVSITANDDAIQRIKEQFAAAQKGASAYRVPISVDDNYRGSKKSLEIAIKLYCGLNPFHIVDTSEHNLVEICAHRKHLKRIKKRFKYWKDYLPMTVQIKYVPMPHHLLRIVRKSLKQPIR